MRGGGRTAARRRPQRRRHACRRPAADQATRHAALTIAVQRATATVPRSPSRQPAASTSRSSRGSSGPLVRIEHRRARRARARGHRRRARRTAPPAADPSPVVGLPPVAFTPEQATLLATASAATAVVGFAGALFGQLTGPISDAFDASDPRSRIASRLTRIGALFALVRHRARRPARPAARDPHRRRRLGVACGALSAVAPNLARLHRRAGAAARLRDHDRNGRGHRGHRGGTRRRARLLGVDARARGRASGSRRGRHAAASPTSERGAGACRSRSARSRSSSRRRSRRHLRETTRYTALAGAPTSCAAASATSSTPSPPPVRAPRRHRAFLTSVFSAPSSQLMNKYLTDEHGFSNTGIALFRTVTTAVPGLIGLVLGGRLAKRAAAARSPRSALAHRDRARRWSSSSAAARSSGSCRPWPIMAAAWAGSRSGRSAWSFPDEARSTSNGLVGREPSSAPRSDWRAAGLLSGPHVGGLGPAIVLRHRRTRGVGVRRPPAP